MSRQKPRIYKTQTKPPAYGVIGTVTRANGKIISTKYKVDDYKNEGKTKYKVLNNIEKYVNARSKQMDGIASLRNQKAWITLNFSDGTYLSTKTFISGRNADFDMWADYANDGRIKKIVSFSFSFMSRYA